MIDIFSSPPDFEDAEENEAIAQYFRLDAQLGGPTLFSINKDGQEIKTPALDWLNSQKSGKFYEIKGIQKEEGSSYYNDLYILTRDLTDEETEELESNLVCCWGSVYEKYTSTTDSTSIGCGLQRNLR